MKILVLLTCFNRKDKTIKCIETLREQENYDWKFIVVDDNSTDGTSEALENYDNLIFIHGSGNLFYSQGMRLAIERGKKELNEGYDFVLMVNDDVVFYKDSIRKLISYLNDDYGIMVGATEYNGELSYGGVIRNSYFRPSYKMVMSGEKKITCDTFNANCVLIPASIFRMLDNIDSAYHHAMGDYDYGLEAGRKGVTIYVSNFFVGTCPRNSIIGTWSDRSLSRRQRIKMKESPKGLPFKCWFYYLKKNFGIFTAILYSVIPYLKILIGL